jgi:hypothetical protein
MSLLEIKHEYLFIPLSTRSLLTSEHHVSLPKDHKKRLKDQVHMEAVTFEYTFKKRINYHFYDDRKKQTIVTNKNKVQHVHQNNL